VYYLGTLIVGVFGMTLAALKWTVYMVTKRRQSGVRWGEMAFIVVTRLFIEYRLSCPNTRCDHAAMDHEKALALVPCKRISYSLTSSGAVRYMFMSSSHAGPKNPKDHSVSMTYTSSPSSPPAPHHHLSLPPPRRYREHLPQQDNIHKHPAPNTRAISAHAPCTRRRILPLWRRGGAGRGRVLGGGEV
jgi:hypothetical protein